MKKLKMMSPNCVEQNVEKIAQWMPNIITETLDEEGNLKKAIDFELLKQELSEVIVEGDKERYQLTWPGKKEAIINANTPINKTLRPIKEDSVDWDTTQNLYIEGDNLEVMKLLQESYLNKVKCIYIDPPYNTGNDFVYNDDYSVDSDEHYRDSGQIDEYDNRLQKNKETEGRFHSKWLTMMYSRLKIARNLLKEDGVIFISIDDSEVDNTQKICDEIFGMNNFIAKLIWSSGRKNDSKFISVSHEYILCYAKNKSLLKDMQVKWRKKKKGLEEIYKQYEKLVKKYNKNYTQIEIDLREWYTNLPNNHPSKDHSNYCFVDKRGIYFADNISWPGGGGPKYEVLHPKTNKAVKIPSRGWMYARYERMQEAILDDRVHFGKDETYVPCSKSYLHDREFEVPYSVFYQDGRAATKRLRTLFDLNIFENPKDETILKEIFSFCCTEDEIILDFFSGSATTAHSVMQLNADTEDKGNRKYIMVQIPEQLEEKSEAYKVGYTNICEIGKERIRRAAQKIKAETSADIDYGFRVYRLDSSNMKDIYYTPNELGQIEFEDLLDNIKEDRTGEDLLTQVILSCGLELSLPMETKQLDHYKIHYVNDTELIACFDENITDEVFKSIANAYPEQVVFRDHSFKDDSTRINVTELFDTLSPNTEIRVL